MHQILAQLIEGVEVLEGKRAGVERGAGVTKIAHALEIYPAYFDHPGWRPLPVKHQARRANSAPAPGRPRLTQSGLTNSIFNG